MRNPLCSWQYVLRVFEEDFFLAHVCERIAYGRISDGVVKIRNLLGLFNSQKFPG
jgi:hypothetical protein